MQEILTKTLSGLVGGVCLSVLGFVRKPNQKFNWKKFLPTVVIAAMFGAIAGASNMELNEVENSAMAGFVALGVNWLFKAAFRRIKGSD